MKLRYKIPFFTLLILFFPTFLTSGKIYAYTLHTNRPANVLRYQVYSGFSTLSKKHFNDAMYEWNAALGKNFLQVSGSHSKTNYPS